MAWTDREIMEFACDIDAVVVARAEGAKNVWFGRIQRSAVVLGEFLFVEDAPPKTRQTIVVKTSRKGTFLCTGPYGHVRVRMHVEGVPND
jgi:hypothetical protein